MTIKKFQMFFSVTEQQVPVHAGSALQRGLFRVTMSRRARMYCVLPKSVRMLKITDTLQCCGREHLPLALLLHCRPTTLILHDVWLQKGMKNGRLSSVDP